MVLFSRVWLGRLLMLILVGWLVYWVLSGWLGWICMWIFEDRLLFIGVVLMMWLLWLMLLLVIWKFIWVFGVSLVVLW